MAKIAPLLFDPAVYLAMGGFGRKIVCIEQKQVFFTQGDDADTTFYLQEGMARLSALSPEGKEATISILAPGDFVGEESISRVVGLRTATATAMTDCCALKIDRTEIIRVIREEHAFSDLFLAFLLARGVKSQADLLVQLFDCSEKRLARILLLMAELGAPQQNDPLIPKITQESLSEMVGTTRSRVSFFMNRFRRLGFIEYNGRIRVHKARLAALLRQS